jgi:hypothetical protein
MQKHITRKSVATSMNLRTNPLTQLRVPDFSFCHSVSLKKNIMLEILDFKFSPCSESCICFFGCFPGVRLFCRRFGTLRSIFIQPLKMDLTGGSETSAKHNLSPGKHPKEHLQNILEIVQRLFCFHSASY